jgi:hypothetical protein
MLRLDRSNWLNRLNDFRGEESGAVESKARYDQFRQPSSEGLF